MRLKKGYFYLILAALSYASMGILVRFLAQELTPFLQTSLRLFVAALLAYILVLYKKKSFSLLTIKDLFLMIFMGVIGYGSSIIAYTTALEHAPVANVLFVLSSHPILTAVLAFVILKEKLHRNLFVGLAFLIIGLTIIFNPSDIFAYLSGNMLAFYSAFTFSLYIIMSRLFSQKYSPEVITFWSVFIAALSSGAGAVFFESVPSYISIQTIIGIISFGCLNFIGYSCINLGFKTVKASTGTMILILEAVFGSILAFFFFAEVPTMLFIFGAILVLTAVYISVKPAKS